MMVSDYNEVWNEPQNIGMARLFKDHLAFGEAVRVTVQPGDATAYQFFFVPVQVTVDWIVSDDGREPENFGYLDRPFGMSITILNEGFAERGGFAWSPDGLDHLEKMMGIRNPCTTAALLATIRAIWP